MKTIVVCCAYAMATSSIMEMGLKEMLSKHGIEAQIVKIPLQQVEDYVKNNHVDLIVPNGRFKSDRVPVISGMPYIIGVGVSELGRKILDVLTAES